MIPLIIQDQFFIIQNLQRSPNPQTSNWSGTFFAVSYSKPALLTYEAWYVLELVRTTTFGLRLEIKVGQL